MDDEAFYELSESIKSIGRAVTPCVAGGRDETGSHVESLTEAVMGVTAGLCRIAESIESLAAAVRQSRYRE